MELDMTKGSPLKLILKFIFPVLLGNIFQQFYNMADTIIVGRCLGVDALAAVGAVGNMYFLIWSFTVGITTGFTVITAQKYGAKDYTGVKKSVFSAMVLSLIVTVVMTILSCFFIDWLLSVMNIPEDVYEMAKAYILVIFQGTGLIILYNVMASLLRAVGNSKAPLYFLVFSSALNIVLDLVFIMNFNLGVFGAGFATVIAQGLSGILCVIYTLKKVKVLVPGKEEMVMDAGIVRNQLSVGIPMSLQFSIIAIGAIMVGAAINKFGSTVIAGYTAANKAGQFASLPYNAIGVTMATFAAQNYGIGDLDRIKVGLKASNILNAIYSIIAYGLIVLTIPFLLKLFISDSSTEEFSELLYYGKTFIVVIGTCYIPLGEIYIYRNALQSCNFSITAMIGGFVELICRGVVATIASSQMNYIGVCAAEPITWLVTGAYYITAFSFAYRKMTKDKENREKSMSLNEV